MLMLIGQPSGVIEACESLFFSFSGECMCVGVPEGVRCDGWECGERETTNVQQG